MRTLLKKRGLGLLAAIILLAAAVGCGKKAPRTGGAEVGGSQSFQVLVPCGQIGPFAEIKALFEKANPQVKTKYISENIAVITQKVLDDKASPDVFMSMGDKEVDQIAAKGRVMEGTRARYARNSLALITPVDNPAGLKGLADLTKPAVKTFAMVDADISSAGYHTREALRKLGIWEPVIKKTVDPGQPEFVPINVARGQAQAGVAYWPCMTETHTAGESPKARKKVTIVGAVPQKLYTPFYCEAVVTKGAKNPEMGKKFIAFLQSPEAQKVFVRWNFRDPESPLKAQ